MQNGLNSPGPFTIFLVFSAGLLTSLGPCSLSLLPVTIAYIGGTEKNKFKLISFSGGVVFSLVALGAASGFLGKIYGQIPSYYTSFVALIAIIMGLNLLGILKFQFPNGPDIKKIEDNKYDNIILISHNPGIQDFCFEFILNQQNNLFFNYLKTKFPTCAAAILLSNTKEWDNIDKKGFNLKNFIIPKSISD